jgi:hypothetical protein
MFDIMFSLDGSLDVLKPLEIDEAFQSMTFCETVDKARTMLEYSAHKIIRDANVQNAVGLIGQHVHITAVRHAAIMKGVDGRDKPGHDGSLS